MKKKIVIFGGGTGLSHVLRELKNFPVDITAVIVVSDSGSSTGRLRKEFLIPGVGDIRKVLSSLSELPEDIKNIMEYRFETYSDLNGHPLGNLVLTAMLNKTKNLKTSINHLSKLLDVRHKVLPLSEDYLTLMGETIEGKIIEGEDNLTRANEKYKRIFYKEKPHVDKEILTAIKEADLVILSMGSLYTSILPHLLCTKITKEIKHTKAKVMYLCNTMTQPGETDNFRVSDHLKILEKYLGKNRINVVVANNMTIKPKTFQKYKSDEQKDFVLIDYKNIKNMGIELIEDDLLIIGNDTVKSNSLKLCSIIFSYLMR